MCILNSVDPVAFFFRDINIYWHGIITALAIGASVICAVRLGSLRKIERTLIYSVTLTALAAGFVFARLIYIFFYTEAFRNEPWLVLRFGRGGYSLLGGMIGCAVSVLLHRRAAGEKTADIFDIAAVSGALGIGIGRLGGIFSREDIGPTVTSEKWQRFPFAIYIPSTDSWSLAVMVLESLCGLAIFAVLIAVFCGRCSGNRAKRGDIALLFMLMFGVSQTQMESMRIDALHLNTLGFVKIMEVSAIVAAAVAIVIFSVRLVRKHRPQPWLYGAWFMIIQGLAVGMYVEFRVSAETMPLFYTTMAIELALVMLSGLIIYYFGLPEENGKKRTSGAY